MDIKRLKKDHRGYNRPMLLMLLDHRQWFQEALFNSNGHPSPKEREQISFYKAIIYEGFEKTLRLGQPKDILALLADEEFSTSSIYRAKAIGLTLGICSEKGGDSGFEFAYGKDYGQHIEKFQPSFIKAHIQFNPEGDTTFN